MAETWKGEKPQTPYEGCIVDSPKGEGTAKLWSNEKQQWLVLLDKPPEGEETRQWFRSNQLTPKGYVRVSKKGVRMVMSYHPKFETTYLDILYNDHSAIYDSAHAICDSVSSDMISWVADNYPDIHSNISTETKIFIQEHFEGIET